MAYQTSRDRHEIVHNTSLLIREFFVNEGRGSPAEVHHYVKAQKNSEGFRAPSYHTTWRYLWVLRQIGLVRKIGMGVSPSGMRNKPIYEAIPERIRDSAWQHPQEILYPAARLGAKRYSALKAQGIEPKGRGI